MLNTKRFAKFSSILITTFLFAFSFANFAYANPTFTVNTSTVGQIDFSGSNLDGISEIYVYLTKKSNGTTQGSGSVPVVSNAFSHSFYGVTEGEEYEYSINGDGAPLKVGSIVLSGGVDTGSSGGVDTGSSGGVDTGSSGGVDTGSSGGVDTGSSGGVDTGSGNNSSAQQILLENPLKNIDSIEELISIILNLVWKIGVWILAGFIIYTGFLFVSARGNPAKIKEAGEALKYTLIGGLILLGAWVIAEAIIGTVEALK
jgi:hypothetical protein